MCLENIVPSGKPSPAATDEPPTVSPFLIAAAAAARPSARAGGTAGTATYSVDLRGTLEAMVAAALRPDRSAVLVSGTGGGAWAAVEAIRLARSCVIAPGRGCARGCSSWGSCAS